MKRKLFTLLLAFLALAGFQANAADPVLTWIATGDSLSSTCPSSSIGFLTNERGGYAGKINDANLIYKLTVENNKFVYRQGPAKTLAGSSDRITVSNPAVNYVTFSQGANKLELAYGGVTYDRFVVFRHSNDWRVPDYSVTDNEKTLFTPGYVLDAQDFKNGDFEGFLAIQANGYPDSGDLLFVVHDKDGNLLLKSYKEYVESFVTPFNNFRVKNINACYYPLYVKSNPLGGRWATAEDFKDCDFWQFSFGGELLEVREALATAGKGGNATPYSIFSVKQVDYVENNHFPIHGGQMSSTANQENIIGINASFQGMDYDKDYPNRKSWDYGTYGPNRIIPLFTLAAPENSCKVLSVSRQNSLRVQTQQDGGYANMLELRDYNQYFDYRTNGGAYDGTYRPHQTTSLNVVRYTSLQKFAIWIDIDGNFVLYPAATYLWQYGEDKEDKIDNIVANPVITYNDINVRFNSSSASSPMSTQPDKINGVQIGRWKGTINEPRSDGYVGTAPNVIQTFSDYISRSYTADCQEKMTKLSGRFYFLEVYPDTVGLWGLGANYNAAFGTGGYQVGRGYVLSTQVRDRNSPNPTKHLVAVPKEEIRTTDREYWRFPYDSVNMAAHWEIKEVTTAGVLEGYRLINMLGDTLQYNITNLSSLTASDSELSGGYLPVNRLWAGDPANPGVKFFGRPTLPWSDPQHDDHWFIKNPRNTDLLGTTPYNTWKFHTLKDKKFNNKSDSTFYMELVTPGLVGGRIGLEFASTWGQGGSNPGEFISSNVTTRYWQRDVVLQYTQTDGNRYSAANSLPSCYGLLVSLKEIDYVPTSGPYYPGDKAPNNSNGIHNTNDKTFQKQDSLTAYTFLEGRYDLVEAQNVQNGLRLGARPVNINDGKNTIVQAASLITGSGPNMLEFIPLSGAIGAQRTDSLKNLFAAAVGNGYTSTTDNEIDYLYGETYKWYLVRYEGKYLTFDTVNVAAQTNREKVGLVFDAILENAIPVRLYQPLVGDKKNDNFLIQFYMPKHTYYPTYAYPQAIPAKERVRHNNFPAIELTSGTERGGGEVCFATLSNESNYIFGTHGYTGSTSGTRFHWTEQASDITCTSEFVDPQWMADNRLLSLPLKNRIWVDASPVNAWIANYQKEIPTYPIRPANESAIVSNNESTHPSTTLTHTYVTSIKLGARNVPAYTNIASVNLPYMNGNASVAGWVDGFQKDLEVPLYYIQNDKGKYLTVVPSSDMRDDNATQPDVNGIQLEWRDLYPNTKANFDNFGYNQQALQLFAISGCRQVKDNWYGKFIYLPLASYEVDYKTGKIVTTIVNGKEVPGILYNYNLGKGNPYGGNDVREAYRISQYAPVQYSVKDLVVFNAQGSGKGNMVPVEFKLSKQEYFKDFCDYQLVQNMNKRGLATANQGRYYTFDGTLQSSDTVNANTVQAHWKIKWDDKDEFMATFEPELKWIYNDSVGREIPVTQLTGKYYFLNKIEGSIDNHETGSVTVRALNIAGYYPSSPNDEPNYSTVIDTLKLTCVKHKYPFFDLEENGGFNIGAVQLAILEAPFVDRSLTFKVNVAADVTPPTPIYSGGKIIGYRTYITKIGDNFDKAEYLNVYKENRRKISDHHIIPYYSFSITKDGVEYFLNVNNKPRNGGVDSVYWTALTDQEQVYIRDCETYPNALAKFKFCLPYKVNAITGAQVDSVAYGDAKYPPVYLQTLDIAKTDYPYLVISGSSTKYVTCRTLNDALLPTYGTSDILKWNIYTMDYRRIDSMKVTSWIFGGPTAMANEWVPLLVNNRPATVEGALTNKGVAGGGVTFLSESGAVPTNYGIMTGLSNAKDKTLRFRFEGDTTIGTWAVRPIWYYRIQLGDENKYLTDGRNIVAPFFFANVPYDQAAFMAKLTNSTAFEAQGINADPNFAQAFGFRYVDDSPGVQSFYVVSHADYTAPKSRVERDYRYLSEVANHLVFLESKDKNDALVFQYGKIDGNGYTNIEVVGKGNIFGVEGGVRVLGAEGNIDIYSIDGRLIKSAVATGADQTIAAPRGVAIVKNGSKTVKVVVK